MAAPMVRGLVVVVAAASSRCPAAHYYRHYARPLDLNLGLTARSRPLDLVVAAAAHYYYHHHHRHYHHARPLGLNLGLNHSARSRPRPLSPDGPECQRDPEAERKRFAAAGAASGVAAACLWPGPGELRRLVRHQVDWQPPLHVLCAGIQAADTQRRQRQRDRQKLIAANMAKMPKMVEEWRREKREAKVKQREEKTRRDRLLAEARERFGYSIDPRNAKFQDMVKELEKEEKKKLKLIKRRKNVEAGGSEVLPTAATA